MRDLLKGSLGRSLEALSEEDRLAAAWSVVCGRTMASHGVVAGYADGVVRVQVIDNAWLSQLMSMQRQLAAEMSRIAGVEVREIHWDRKRNGRHE
jgi:predicted nucleic acid-binding Zn ribbon protein